MARDKAVDPTEIDTSKLPNLTEQQMAFALQILDGKTATEAYLLAYPTSQTWPRASVWAHASRTLNHDKVLAWLSAWRAQAMVSGVTTIEEHTAQLMRIRELALASGNYGAAAKCEESRGRANGLYVDRIETKDTTRQAVDILARLDPALRALLGPQLGLDLGNSDADTSPEKETKH